MSDEFASRDSNSEVRILPILNERPPLLSDSQTIFISSDSLENTPDLQEMRSPLPSHILLNSLPQTKLRQIPITARPQEKPTTTKIKSTTPSPSPARQEMPAPPEAVNPSDRPQHDSPPWPGTPRRDGTLIYNSEVVEFVPLAERPGPANPTSAPPPPRPTEPHQALPRSANPAPTQSDTGVSGDAADAGNHSDFGSNEILRTGPDDDEEKLAARVAMTTTSPAGGPGAAQTGADEPPPVPPLTVDSTPLPATPRTVSVTVSVDGGELYQLSLVLPTDNQPVSATLQKTATAPAPAAVSTAPPALEEDVGTEESEEEGTENIPAPTDATPEPTEATTTTTTATTAATTASTTSVTTPVPETMPAPTTTEAATEAATEETSTQTPSTTEQTAEPTEPATAVPSTPPAVEASEPGYPATEASSTATTSLPPAPPQPPTESVVPVSVTPTPSCIRPSTVTVTFPPPVPVIVVKGGFSLSLVFFSVVQLSPPAFCVHTSFRVSGFPFGSRRRAAVCFLVACACLWRIVSHTDQLVSHTCPHKALRVALNS